MGTIALLLYLGDGVFVSYPCQVYKFALLLDPSLAYNGPSRACGGRQLHTLMAICMSETTLRPDGSIYDAASGNITARSMEPATIPALDSQIGSS